MRLLLAAAICVTTPNLATAQEAARVKVVVTLPDLADLVSAIGGDRVEVKALARPGQNLHAVRVKPSHLVALSRADLFVQVGLSLEHSWVPGLIRASRNRSVLPGAKGFVSAGAGYATIEVPESVDRGRSADVHPAGNPHVNLSLGGGPHMAERILAGLIRVDAAGAAKYRKRHAAWLEHYVVARARWDAIAAAVRKTRRAACVYHQEFDYLLDEMGLEIAAFLEPRPGLPPTPVHLARVVETVREREIPVILTAPWSNNKHCARVARLTDASILELPVMVGGTSECATWIGMIDDCVAKIAEAYGVDVEAVLSESKANEGRGKK